MNKKRKFKTDKPQNERLASVEIKIAGRTRTLAKPNEVRLVGKPGRPEARYRFAFAERQPDGRVLLNVFGPVGRKSASMRYVDPADVIVWHRGPQKPRVAREPESFCSNCLAPVPVGKSECGTCRE
ncbi:hypothetical protein SEA_SCOOBYDOOBYDOO_225 [Mycobacterium phage ScoobyDoobyDoo]|nr:hypothetical protein SEA_SCOOBYDOOBYDOO_225 [Mycobacterium phage ScoobyDoobyDoo]